MCPDCCGVSALFSGVSRLLRCVRLVFWCVHANGLLRVVISSDFGISCGFPVALSYVACLSRVFLFLILTIHHVDTPFCLVLSCLVLSCLVLSCLVFLSCLVLSCLVLPCLALSCLVLPCLALPCLALPCLALPCLVLSVLPCLVLSCLVLSCLVLSCLVLVWFGFGFLLNFPTPNHKKLKHCFYVPSFWLGINNLLIMLIFVTNKPVVEFHITQLQQLKQSFTFILLHRNKRRITKIVECHSLGKYNISIIFTGIWISVLFVGVFFFFFSFSLIFLVLFSPFVLVQVLKRLWEHLTYLQYNCSGWDGHGTH